MSKTPNHRLTARCSCGKVEFEALGAPIASLVCYCDDCQAGSRQIEALPNAHAVQDGDGGTGYVLYRKDRVRCIAGADLLERFKLNEKTPTSRVVARCCNSGMAMTFDDARHWASMYRLRFEANAPPVQMRICTRFKSEGVDIPNDAPSYKGFPVTFLATLLKARIAMAFGR